MFLLSWIMFGALCSIMSRHKGYSAAIGVIAGVVGGIFGLVFILVLPDRIQEQEDFIQRTRNCPLYVSEWRHWSVCSNPQKSLFPL